MPLVSNDPAIGPVPGALNAFHPLMRDWFAHRFPAPTEAQAAGWEAIRSGTDTLIAAPTGSGKTLAAFLVAIDDLVRAGLAGSLAEETRVVYVSPLKALTNDVERNLNGPLREIQELAAFRGVPLPEIRVGLRTGDTTAARRQALVRRPPHILVTTPESLFLLLTAERGREILRNVKTVIIDEIHALARDKRGSHLALSLERLDALSSLAARPLRVGLSATQQPIERVARFLTGTGRGADAPCRIVDRGHRRDLDLAVEVPESELSAVCSNEQWAEVYGRLRILIESHRSTLVFVNTRAMAERVSYYLCEHLGEDAVASHHGSLSKEIRLRAEERLKNGELRAIVATASLELGIDIGYIDLVCQIGSPRSIAAFLQRVGRSGHAVGALPRGRLFALTRDELIESLALIQAVRAGRLDPVEIPRAPLDILAQQIIAAAACDEWDEDELYALVRRAAPYENLERAEYDQVVRMLADGYGKDRPLAYIHYDAINRKLRGRSRGRLAAITSGGAIPEQPAYRVVNIEDNSFVGTIHEDFAVERPAGTIFLLGNTSWQMINTRGLQVNVRDAKGAPPSMPFWFGEAPWRTFELSTVVSELREAVGERIEPGADDETIESVSQIRHGDPPAYRAARAFLKTETAGHDWAILQAVHYIAVQKAGLGLIPGQRRIVFERFFDQTGGTQLVIHAPFGTRVNRAWGLALRKSFCRSFDFELQASADDDGIVLSLGDHQSFPLEQLFHFVTPANARPLLEQAFLQVPFFRTRWQWNANRALAVLRTRAGKRVAPALQRMRGEDLLTAVFPASTQCFEHITGDIELPDHPLVKETMRDCLYEAADLERLTRIVGDIQSGAVELIARDTREPSPFAYERLNASPYAFLDDAGLLDRRARALAQRRTLPIHEMRDLARLDESAIERVRLENWPAPRGTDALHEVLYNFGVLRASEAGEWTAWFEELVALGRAARCFAGEREFYFAAERLPLVRAAYPEARMVPDLNLPARLSDPWTDLDAQAFVLTARLNLVPALTAAGLAEYFGFAESMVRAQLEAIEAGGRVMRGHFRGTSDLEWCDRRLLRRIHRLTLDGLRNQIRAVSVRDFVHFLFQRHGLLSDSRRAGRDGLAEALGQLEGFAAPAGRWENEILPARVKEYNPAWLDELCVSGQWTYGRLRPPVRAEENPLPRMRMSRAVPLAFARRENLPWLFADLPVLEAPPPGTAAALVFDSLRQYGAQFTAELLTRSGLAPLDFDRALGELFRAGLLTADSFAQARVYISPEFRRSDRLRRLAPAGGGRAPAHRPAGRWALFPGLFAPATAETAALRWAWLLLERYGVLFRDLLARESVAPGWSVLGPVLRKLEAQGRVRGGRFIAGVSGEQFALPGVIEGLRAARDRTPSTEIVVLSAADPLNLVGVLLNGPRPGARAVRPVFRDGVLVATREGGRLEFHENLAGADLREIALAVEGERWPG